MPSRSIKGLADLGKLAAEAEEAHTAKARIKLTQDHEVKFKMVFSHQIEEEYNFDKLITMRDPELKRELNDDERLKIYELLAKCVQKYTNRSITSVAPNFRRSDKTDKAYDPIDEDMREIQHFSLDDSNGGTKSRIHGYFNSYGYFVVTRLDRFHLYHLRKERAQSKRK